MGVKNYLNRHRDHYSEILKWGKESRFNLEYCIGKWEFIAKGQGGVSGWKILREKHQG